MEEKNKLFAKNLRYYMDKADMSQIELAKRLGVSTSTVSLYCTGKNVPRISGVAKIASILGVDISQLVGETELTKGTTQLLETSDTVCQSLDGTKMLIECHYIKGNEERAKRMQKMFDKIMSLSPKDMNFVESMVDRLVGEND